MRWNVIHVLAHWKYEHWYTLTLAHVISSACSGRPGSAKTLMNVRIKKATEVIPGGRSLASPTRALPMLGLLA